MILIAISSRYLGATIPFILLVCVITQRLYIRTSRQLRFLDLEAEGPLYTQFIETLNGLHTLRAFNLHSTLSTELSLLLDASQKPFYLSLCVQRWLGLVLNLTNMGLVLMLIGVAIATKARFHASGFLGVALINIMTFGNSLASFINVWTTLETSLAAVERVIHF
jgi:ATP-binding cassette subfamily C (CFTR/MRP) protein 1